MMISYNITPYKGRTINFSKKVRVYRCLTRKGCVYSIQQGGKVVAHTSDLILRDVNFKINRSGKKRAIETGIRNVHAMIDGYIDNTLQDTEVVGTLKYYPFCEDNFMCNGKEITSCEVVTINENKLTVDKYTNRWV